MELLVKLAEHLGTHALQWLADQVAEWLTPMMGEKIVWGLELWKILLVPFVALLLGVWAAPIRRWYRRVVERKRRPASKFGTRLNNTRDR